jgi:hypothetical protein
MTPFQAIKATAYMLLAKAREPIGDSELIPVPSGVGGQRAKAERPSHLLLAQKSRRRSDSPVQHASLPQRIWRALIAWFTSRRAGTKG